jgi:hypothetical protein
MWMIWSRRQDRVGLALCGRGLFRINEGLGLLVERRRTIERGRHKMPNHFRSLEHDYELLNLGFRGQLNSRGEALIVLYLDVRPQIPSMPVIETSQSRCFYGRHDIRTRGPVSRIVIVALRGAR